MEAFIIIGSISAYVIVIGFVSKVWFDYMHREGHTCDTPFSCEDGPHWSNHPELMVTLLWPFAIFLVPVVLGVKLGGLTNNSARAKARQSRKDREHQRKIELLKAETERNESARRLVEDYKP